MAIKKNAAKANIGPKKQVKATFAECTAEDPLKCRYHGPKMLQAELDKQMGKGAAKVKKTKNGYEITSDDAYDAYEKVAALLPNAKGSLGVKKAFFILGDGGFVTPDGEAELEDADILSSANAPEKNQSESDDLDDLEGAHTEEPDLSEFADIIDAGVGEGIEPEKQVDEFAEFFEAGIDDGIVPEDEQPAEDEPIKDLSEEDIKNLVSFKGVTDDHFEQNPDLLDTYKAIITNGTNPNGDALNEHQKVWWNDLLSQTKDANEDELPALKVLKATMKKVSGYQEQSSEPKNLTERDIVAAFSPIYDPEAEEIGDQVSLADNKKMLGFYKHVLEHQENPPNEGVGPELVDSQLEWFKKASQKAHAAGVDNYALELLDKMLVDKGVIKKVDDNNEAEMEKCKAKWNNLMDTAINGKHLLGTQYWAETLKPIVDAYNDAVEANDVVHAFDAVYDLKNAVKEAPENGASKPPTKDSLIAEMGNVIAKIKDEGLDLTWDAKKGNALGKAFEDAINAGDIDGATKALKDFKDYVEFLESGGDAPEDDEEGITTEDIKDFFTKCGYTGGIMHSEDNLAATKDALETGKWNGKPLTKGNKKWYEALAKKVPGHKVANAINEMLSNDKKTRKAGKKGAAKEALVSALGGKSEVMVSDEVLKPLEHDELKFPKNVTQEMLDKAIEEGDELGGASGENATLVHIDGIPYVIKAGTGSHAEHLHNEVMADMAYRAGGIRAADCMEYNFKGKTYKVAEFIKGKSLYDYMKTATEDQKEAVRKDLLRGFPLDVLFSNWDVLGADRDNVMVDEEGHCWRIDNGGAFSMAAKSNKKSLGFALSNFKDSVEFENWEEKGGWDKREWIDDFRTMRIGSIYKGIFDKYTTADIFLSAGNINLGAAVEAISDEGVREALAKPLFEMKQMTWRALNLSLGGYKDNSFISMALDASYEASKRGLREYCTKDVGWNDAGYGQWKDSWGSYQKKPFGEKKPDPPKNPKDVLNNSLENDDYTGTQIASILLTAIKSINYHGGVKQKDANGNPVGNGSAQGKPDYTPNAVAIAQYDKIDRDKLAELAKTDDSAKKLLDFYDLVKYSRDNGWKKPIGAMPLGLSISAKLPEGYQSPYEKKITEDMAGEVAQYEKDMEKYKKDLAEYQKRLDAHNKREAANAARAGSSPYHGFMDFADTLINEGINSYGIAHTVATSGVEPIETSMVDQKHNSYYGYGKDWKVRLWQAMGYSLADIKKNLANGTFINGAYSGESMTDIIKSHAEGNPAKWESDLASQAMFCGLQMIYLENSQNAMFDKESGVVFVNRNIPPHEEVSGLTAKEKAIYSDPDASGWVGPHPYAAADCMQFEMNDWGSSDYNCQVYALPFANLICCSNMSKASGHSNLTGGYGGENEYVGNLNNQPCWVYHKGAGLSWKGAIDEAKKSKGMKAWLKKLATRLNPFNTLKSQ